MISAPNLRIVQGSAVCSCKAVIIAKDVMKQWQVTFNTGHTYLIVQAILLSFVIFPNEVFRYFVDGEVYDIFTAYDILWPIIVLYLKDNGFLDQTTSKQEVPNETIFLF